MDATLQLFREGNTVRLIISDIDLIATKVMLVTVGVDWLTILSDVTSLVRQCCSRVLHNLEY